MKTIIRNLSNEIEDILEQNAIANEMNALIDFGEWSGCDPNFSQLIKKNNLTREQLISYTEIAKEYADKWFEMFPKEARKNLSYEKMMSFEYCNPWQVRLENLHCIFMAGFLNEK